MYKTFDYGLFPNRSQRALLLSRFAEGRRLYNGTIETVRAHYERSGTFLGRYELTYRFEGRGGEHGAQSTVQALADRLDKALKRFFRCGELGQKAGFPAFPRFKGANH